MYPAAPNFREPAPGSAWFGVELAPGQNFVAETQYDALLRAFQAKARTLLPAVYLFDRQQGRCPTGALETLAVAWSANLRRASELTDDGRFGPETADALGYLLCASGQTTRAQEWAQALTAGTIPGEFLRQMFWFAQFVQRVDSPSEPGFEATLDGAKITLASNAVLPTPQTIVGSAPEDRTWIAFWRPNVDPRPTPPSAAAAPPPQPQAPQPSAGPTRVSGLAAVAIVALSAAAGWFLAPSFFGGDGKKKG
jgi:hypothetical protein